MATFDTIELHQTHHFQCLHLQKSEILKSKLKKGNKEILGKRRICKTKLNKICTKQKKDKKTNIHTMDTLNNNRTTNCTDYFDY